jgi:hypothetical protein
MPEEQYVPKGEWTKASDGSWSIDGLEVATTGLWNGRNVSPAFLDLVVESTNEVFDKARPNIVLGDHDNPIFSSVAMGQFTGKLRRIGKAIYGDVKNIPDTVAQMVRKGMFRTGSMQVRPVFADTTTGRVHHFVLEHFAFLGAKQPAMKTLREIQTPEQLASFCGVEPGAVPAFKADKPEDLLRIEFSGGEGVTTDGSIVHHYHHYDAGHRTPDSGDSAEHGKEVDDLTKEELDKREAELATRETAIKAKAVRAKQDLVDFSWRNLLEGGKVEPAGEAAFKALAMSIDHEITIKFVDAKGATVEKTPLEVHLSREHERGKVVEFSQESGTTDDTKGKTGTGDAVKPWKDEKKPAYERFEALIDDVRGRGYKNPDGTPYSERQVLDFAASEDRNLAIAFNDDPGPVDEERTRHTKRSVRSA